MNAASIAIPHLRGGAFIAVGSVTSDFGVPLLGAYAASKHAIKGFVDSLRIEHLVEHIPISITLIKPSGVATPFAEHAATHLPYAAKTPPPAYAPDLVARAILFAAQHPRREITVGGAGAFEILGAKLLPRAADRISAWFRPYLLDHTREPSGRHNLFTAGRGGRERSARERALEHSLYTDLMLRGGTSTKFIVLGLAAAAGLSWAAIARVRPRAARDGWRGGSAPTGSRRRASA